MQLSKSKPRRHGIFLIKAESPSRLTCGTVRRLGPSSLFGRLPPIRGVFSALLALPNAMVVK
jgi:hypothetical protein